MDSMIIGYNDHIIAIVPDRDFAINKIREWNNESVVEFAGGPHVEEGKIYQRCPDGRVIYWWYKTIRDYTKE